VGRLTKNKESKDVIVFKSEAEIEFCSNEDIATKEIIFPSHKEFEIKCTFDMTKEIEEFFFGKDPLQ